MNKVRQKREKLTRDKYNASSLLIHLKKDNNGIYEADESNRKSEEKSQHIRRQ